VTRDALNALAFVLALALAMVGGGVRLSDATASVSRPSPAGATPTPERLPDGRLALRDVGGTLVPLAPYRRIASATLVADRALADLCEPDRIVAFTRHAAATPSGHRYAGKALLGARDPLERVLALAPDLLLVSDLVDPRYVARLREQGIAVFDLGPMRGLETLLPTLRTIGVLIGAPERAARYADTLAARMRAVAPVASDAPRPRALYLAVYGERLFGAGDHTSYHDVLTYAGLADAVAEHGLSGWPELSPEQVLALAPAVLVTRTGMSAVLCRHPGLDRLDACRGTGRVVELDGALLDDPGPGLLEATEALHDALGAPAAP